MIREKLSGIKDEEKGLTRSNPIGFINKIYNEYSFIRMHYHSSFEINICRNMKGTINIEGDSVDLSDLSLIFLPPATLHSYRISGNGGSVTVWHIGLSLFSFLNNQIIEELLQKKSLRFHNDESKIKEIESILIQIKNSKDFLQSSYVLKLLGMFYKPGIETESIYSYDSFLHKIIFFSESSFNEHISLNDAAEAVNLSRYHFSRKFKEKTGSTYMEYINNLRLESSLGFLRREFSVSETAEKSGFEDVSYFIKKFKQMYNKTPLEYQKSLKDL